MYLSGFVHYQYLVEIAATIAKTVASRKYDLAKGITTPALF